MIYVRTADHGEINNMPNFVDKLKRAIAQPELEDEETVDSLNSAVEKKKEDIQRLQADIRITGNKIEQVKINHDQKTEALKSQSHKKTAALKEESIPVKAAIQAAADQRKKNKAETDAMLKKSKEQMDQTTLEAEAVREDIRKKTEEATQKRQASLEASKAEKEAELKKKTDAALREAASRKQQLQQQHEKTVALENQRRAEIAKQVESLKSIFNEQEQKSLDSINRQSENNRITADQYEEKINALIERNQARIDAENEKLEAAASKQAAQLQMLSEKNQNILTAKRDELIQLNEQEASLKSQLRNQESALRRTGYQLNNEYQHLNSRLTDEEAQAAQELADLERTLANEQAALALEQKNYQDAKALETARAAALLSKISQDNQAYNTHAIQVISDTQNEYAALYQRQAEEFNALYIQEKEKIDLDLENYKKDTLKIESQLVESRNQLDKQRIEKNKAYTNRLSELKENLARLQKESNEKDMVCKARLETLKQQNAEQITQIQEIIAKNSSEHELKKKALADVHEKYMHSLSDQETEITNRISTLNQSVIDTKNALEALMVSAKEQTESLTQLKNEAAAKTAVQIKDLKDKLQHITNQCEEEKQKSKQILAKFTADRNQIIKAQEKQIQERTEEHQKRLDELKKQSDAQLAELKENHSKAMSLLQAQHNQKIVGLEKAYQQMEADYAAQLDDVRKAINTDKARQEESLQKQIEIIAEFNDAEKTRNEQRCQEVTELTASLNSALKDQQQLLTQLTKQIADTETNIKAEYQRQIDNAIAQIAALKDNAKDIKNQADKAEAEFNNTKDQLIEQGKTAQEEFNAQIAAFNKQVTDSRNELDRSREAMESAIRNDQITVETEQKQVESLVERNKDELNQLDIQIASELNAKQVNNKEFLSNLTDSYRQQLQAETQRWTKEETDLNAKILAEEKELLGEHEALLAQKDISLKQYEAKKKALEDEFTELKTASSRKDSLHQDEILALNKKVHDSELNYKSRASMLKSNRAATLKDLSIRNADRQSEFNKEIVDIENRIYVLKSSLASKTDMQNDALEQLKKEEEGRVEDRKKTIASYQSKFVEIGNAYDDMENSLQKNKADHETQLKHLQEERIRIRQEHDQLISSRNKHKQEALAQADDELRKYSDQQAEEFLKLAEEAKKQYDIEGKTAALNAQVLKLKQDNEKLNTEITDFINRSQTEYEDKVKENNIRRIKLQNDEKDRLRKHAEELEQLKQAAATRIADLQNTNAKLEHDIAAEVQRVSAAQAKKDQENADLKLQLDQQEKTLRNEIKNKETEFARSQAEFIQNTSMSLDAHKAELAKIKEAIAAKTQDIQNQKRKLEQASVEYDKEKQEEQKKIEQEIFLLQQEKDNETARISRIIERQRKVNDKLLEKKRKIAEKEYREKERAFEEQLDNLLRQQKITEDFYKEKYSELQDFLKSRQEVAQQRLEKEAFETSKAEETMTLSIEALKKAEAVEINDLRDAHNAEKKVLLAKRAALEQDLDDVKRKTVNDIHNALIATHENNMKELNKEYAKANAAEYSESLSLKEQANQRQEKFDAETDEFKRHLDQLKLQEENLRNEAVQRRIDIDNEHRDAIEEQLIIKADLEQDIKDQKDRLEQFEGSVREQRRIEKERSMEINNVYQQKLEGIKRLN